MPKIKKSRIGVKLDMTPMVDVAFLLLTFFMLTTQFRPPEEVEVILPSSHSAIKVPEIDVLTISISKDGNIFLGVDAQALRTQLFGEEAKLKLAVQVELSALPELLRTARSKNPKLRTIIKADRNVEYGPIQDVMDILGAVMITRFNLVTDLEIDTKSVEG